MENPNTQRIELGVLGISYSQIQSGAYALILAQVNGPIRIPVVIGPAEAQAIAMQLEGIKAPRPMTHDLLVNISRAFGIGLKEVFIYKFKDGIFSSEMTFADAEREVTIDARTSDAVAVAMRFDAPIYTTREILDETGFVMDERDTTTAENATENTPAPRPSREMKMPDVEKYTVGELEKTLARLIEEENYEEASRIRDILRRKRGDAPSTSEKQ